MGELARGLGLPCTLRRFDVPAYARERGLSDEEAARRTRYAFLGRLAAKLGADVAVAHSADDQAETVLMNVLRGTGVSGLGGMQMLGPLPLPAGDEALGSLWSRGSGIGDRGSESWMPADPMPDPRSPIPVMLFRPLLGVWRREIEECRRWQAVLEWSLSSRFRKMQ